MYEQEITKTEVVTKTIYIAKDGTEFNNKEDCIHYESNCEFYEREEAIKALPHIETNSAVFGFDYNSEDEDVWVFKPKNAEEIRIISEYIGEIDGNYIDETCIGQYIAINFGSEKEFTVVTNLMNNLKLLIDNTMRKIGELDNVIEEKENKENK